MRNLIVYLTVLLFILVGCSNENGNDYGREPGITGYVMDKEGQEILVVSTEAKDYGENGGIEEFYDAV